MNAQPGPTQQPPAFTPPEIEMPYNPRVVDAAPPPGTEPTPVYAFTSPETGVAYTRGELDQWSRGKVDGRGDTVFFKPGFVCADPWFRLRDRPRDRPRKRQLETERGRVDPRNGF